MTLEFINAPGLHAPEGYSYAAVATGRRAIELAGQVAVDAQDRLVGEDDYQAQTEQAVANLVLALEATGASVSDLAKMTVYVVGLTPETFEAVFEGLSAAYDRHGLGEPASVTIGVTALTLPGALIEVDGVAYTV